MTIILIVILAIVIALGITCVRIVPQAETMVVERLGSYLTTWGNGLHFKLPLIDRVRATVSLKEQVADFPPQPVITKDNVTMSIDTVVFYKVMDPRLYCYGVENPIIAIENLTATTLRNIIGDLFSGIALSVEAPYRIGDWIETAEGCAGRVVEVSWRATRLVTRDGVTQVVPNGLVAAHRLTNYGAAGSYRVALRLPLPAALAPERARRVLLAAALDAGRLGLHPRLDGLGFGESLRLDGVGVGLSVEAGGLRLRCGLHLERLRLGLGAQLRLLRLRLGLADARVAGRGRERRPRVRLPAG